MFTAQQISALANEMLSTVELELQQMNIDVTPSNFVNYLRKRHRVVVSPDDAKEWINSGSINGQEGQEGFTKQQQPAYGGSGR